jgi:hypothetical protein
VANRKNSILELGSEDIAFNQVVVKAGKRKKYIDTTANFVYAQVRDNREEIERAALKVINSKSIAK